MNLPLTLPPGVLLLTKPHPWAALQPAGHGRACNILLFNRLTKCYAQVEGYSVLRSLVPRNRLATETAISDLGDN